MTVPGLGSTDKFPFQKGGSQGGVETPTLFNLILDYVLEPLFEKWQQQGFGYSFDGTMLIDHLVWCDNLYTVAKSQAEATCMARGYP